MSSSKNFGDAGGNPSHTSTSKYLLRNSLSLKKYTEFLNDAEVHVLCEKAKKLIYRRPVTGDAVIFDRSPY
jgi:hypothetical protein